MSRKNNSKNDVGFKILCVFFILVLLCLMALLTVSFMSTIDLGHSSTPSSDADMAKLIADLDIEKNPVATIEMENGGIITLELYPNIAPNTVCNFISLANSGFYDGLIFHRCIEGFMIQGGDPMGTGSGGPDYTIGGEFSGNGFENDLKHERGVLSMARTNDPDSAGSQFFIMVEYNSHLDGDYAAFGKVTDGMNVVDDIVSQETNEMDRPLEDQVMKKVTVDTFGVEYPKPVTFAK